MPRLDTSWRLGAQLAWRGEADRARLTEEGVVDAFGGWGLEGEEGGGMGKGGVVWS